jgi:GNAT superfamily N-acetyltransferase
MSVLTGQWRSPAPLPSREELISNPHHGRYLDGWMREGDAGVVAVDGERPIGAAWYRRFSADEPGYGFLDEATPEISIAVDSRHRGRGLGTALLHALCERAGHDGLGALCLSVERDNPALRIYRRLGFVEVEGTNDACTMRLDLSEEAEAARRPSSRLALRRTGLRRGT